MSYRQRLLNAARATRESPVPTLFDTDHLFSPDGQPLCVLSHYLCRSDLQDEFEVQTPGGGATQVIVKATGQRVLDYPDTMSTHFGVTEEEYFDLFCPSSSVRCRSFLAAAEYVEEFAEHKFPR